MGEKISLADFSRRIGITDASAQRIWRAGILVGERCPGSSTARISLDWEESLKAYCEVSRWFKIHGDEVINLKTGKAVYKLSQEELIRGGFLQNSKNLQKKDVKENDLQNEITDETTLRKRSVSELLREKKAKETEIKKKTPINKNLQKVIKAKVQEHLKEFAKLGLQVYDINGNPKNIITLAREQEALFKAKRAQLDYEKDLQRLVDINLVQRLIANLAVDTCKAILSVPDRVAPVLSTMDDSYKIHKYLTEELKFALDTLSRTLEEMFENVTNEEYDNETVNDF